ncbi:MAG: T9SS type A sorting domain-containing protein [Bacteroidota bacterium]
MKNFCFTFVFMLCLQLGFGQIGFEEKIIIDDTHLVATGDNVLTSDLNGDGFLDVIYTSSFEGSGRKLGWYRNLDGQGNFGQPEIIADSLYYEFNNDMPLPMKIADIDGDGDNDIICSQLSNTYGHKIMYYENLNGLGDFSEENIILEGIATTDFELVDIDGDNDLDLVHPSITYGISWQINLDGLGNFSAPINTGNIVNLRTISITSADLDDDNDLDIIFSTCVFSGESGIYWFENIGGSSVFGSVQNIALSTHCIVDVYTDDLNNDGAEDIISVGGSGFSDLKWYNNTDGLGTSFTESLVNGNLERANTMSFDVDGDGDKDIVSSHPSLDVLGWFENTNGLGLFNPSPVALKNDMNKIAFSTSYGDLNNDGVLDLLFINKGEFQWLKNNDMGNYDFPELIDTGHYRYDDVLMDDFNYDGYNDILVSSSNRLILFTYNSLNNDFGEQQIFNYWDPIFGSESDDIEQLYYDDVNGDGYKDIIAQISSQHIWFENINGTGTFDDFQLINFNDQPISSNEYQWIDLDGDTDLDMLYWIVGSGSIYWIENTDGLFNFSSSISIPIGTVPANLRPAKVGDINGDGHNDIIVKIWSFNLSIYYNSGNSANNTYNDLELITDQISYISDFFIYDVDSDGHLDILISYNDGIGWLKNTDGLGNFSNLIPIPIDYQSDINDGIKMNDLDNDGDNDLIISKWQNGPTYWYENVDGNGLFGVGQLLTNKGTRKLLCADFENDGDIDILVAHREQSTLGWLENLGVQFNKIQGYVRYDYNGLDCNIDTPLNNILLSASDGVNTYSNFNQYNGFYQLFPGEGNYITQIQNLPNYYISNPVSSVSNFSGVGNTDTIDFCIEPAGVFNDLTVSVYPSIADPRPGFNTTYQLVYNNIGTTQLSGSVTFEFDDSKVQFLSASETVSSQTVNTLSFDFTDLNPFETRTINLVFNVFPPPTTNINDILVSTATISPVSGDETEEDNEFILEQTVIGSYDPNDITVLQGDEIFIEDADKYLNYLIRFQNTGTASAINVRVEHILDDKLDWSTMQLESLSHTGRVEIENETDISFIFNNIHLPDSTSNEPESHGYIAFKIKPKPDVEVGDIISGVADIYFDFNPPIITNTVNTEIVEPLSIDDQDLQSFKLHPNPAKDRLRITSRLSIEGLRIVDMNGRELNRIEVSTGDYSLDVSSLSPGIYFLEIGWGALKSTQKFIKK